MMTFKAMASTVLALALGAGVASAQQLDPPIDAQVGSNETSAESQKRVEDIATATDSLTADYRLTLKKIESLQIFNRQLSQVIDSQNEELESLQRQIDSVEEVGRSVTPLMLEMIEALDQFVQHDVPFLGRGAEESRRRSPGADATLGRCGAGAISPYPRGLSDRERLRPNDRRAFGDDREGRRRGAGGLPPNRSDRPDVQDA